MAAGRMNATGRCHLPTDQEVRGSNPFGRARTSGGYVHLASRRRTAMVSVLVSVHVRGELCEPGSCWTGRVRLLATLWGRGSGRWATVVPVGPRHFLFALC